MARPSDQWLKKEDVEVTTGDIALETGVSYIGLATVDIGTGNEVVIGAGEAYTGLATVDIGTIPEVVQEGFSSKQYLSNSTVEVSGAAGLLHSVSVHIASCPTISIWDSTLPSGTKIMDIPPDITPNTFTYNINVTNGIAIQATAGVTPNIVITYR